MRAHALQGRLLDVQLDGVAVLVDADRHPQPVGLRPRCPQRPRVERGQVVDSEQLGQVEVGGERLGDLGRGAEPERRDEPRADPGVGHA